MSIRTRVKVDQSRGIFPNPAVLHFAQIADSQPDSNGS